MDLASGDLRWEIPLGVPPTWHPLGPALEEAGVVGLPNGGGPIITAGGLVFIGATIDDHFRAFDVETGAMLWDATLPLSTIATPMTYEIDGKQYVVIAAGGHGKMGVPTGDYVVAFALP